MQKSFALVWYATGVSGRIGLTIGRVVELAFVLLGCAAPPLPVYRWSKPQSTYDQYLKDRYACITDARAQAGSAYVNQYGGAAQSGRLSAGAFSKPVCPRAVTSRTRTGMHHLQRFHDPIDNLAMTHSA
jgi:hypothetical protein